MMMLNIILLKVKVNNYANDDYTDNTYANKSFDND